MIIFAFRYANGAHDDFEWVIIYAACDKQLCVFFVHGEVAYMHMHT
jgi:hypothetical protein